MKSCIILEKGNTLKNYKWLICMKQQKWRHIIRKHMILLKRDSFDKESLVALWTKLLTRLKFDKNQNNFVGMIKQG
jgi:hypothetical protein